MSVSAPFNKGAARFYSVEGSDRDLPSVTTILSAIAKPALVQWSAKMERALVGNIAKETRLATLDGGDFSAELDTRLKQTKYACNLHLAEAGEIGSAIHEAVECAIKGVPIPEMRPEVKTGFEAWCRWRDEVELEVLMCEQRVYSLKYGFAGTGDLIARGYFLNQTPEPRRKLLVLGDNKSSKGKGIYFEYVLQLAAYREALREMGHFTDERMDGLIIKIPKTVKDGTVTPFFIASEDLDEHFKTFLAVRDLWVAIKRFESDKRYR